MKVNLNKYHHYIYSICVIFCLSLLSCSGAQRDNNIKNVDTAFRTSDYKLEARANALIFMAQLIRDCMNGDSYYTYDTLDTMYTNQFEIVSIHNDTEEPLFKTINYSIDIIINNNDISYENKSIELNKLYGLGINNLIKLNSNTCITSACSDLAFVSMKSPNEFILLLKLLDNEVSKLNIHPEIYDELEIIANDAELATKDLIQKIINISDSNNSFNYPYDFGQSPYDILEHARFLIEMDRIRCPLASEEFISHFVNAIKKTEDSYGSKPEKYKTFINKVYYFSKFTYINSSLLHFIINRTDEFEFLKKNNQLSDSNIEKASLDRLNKAASMLKHSDGSLNLTTNTLDIDITAILTSPSGQYEKSKRVLSMMIPGYNTLWFSAKIISSIYQFPEEFIIMHLIYPREMAEFYRRIKNHESISVEGVNDDHLVNKFLKSAYVPTDFGEEYVDMLMAARYWSDHLPLSYLITQTQWFKGPIDQSLRLMNKNLLLPPKYSNETNYNRYFSQFDITPQL